MMCRNRRFNSYLILIFIIALSSNLSFAQDANAPINTWRSHLSYETPVAITESEEAAFFASTQAVLKVNKADQSLEHLNKVSGLSDMGVKTLEYNQQEDILIIAYENGNIDLLYENGYVENLAAILKNNNIIGDKSINHIFNIGKKIYFSCAFGLVVYDLDLEAFSQTTFTPYDVNACSQLNDTLFMSTAQGIYAGVLDGRNLLDFNIWERQGAAEGLDIGNYSSRNLINFNNRIYADARDTLFQYYNGKWQHINGYDVTQGTPITAWRPTGNGDFVTNFNMSLNYAKDKLIITSNTSKYFTITANNDITTHHYPGSWRVRDMIIDQDDIHWAADQAYKHRNFQYVQPNAPLRNVVADMHVDKDGTLWVASSPYNKIGANFSTSGLFQYKEGIWTIFNKNTRPEMDTFYDAVKVTSNPENGKVYVGSFMSGLLEIDAAENIEIYDKYNTSTPLTGVLGDEQRTRVIGLAVDEDGVLWMSNSGTHPSTLVSRTLGGAWHSFPSSYFSTEFKTEDIVIDRNGYKWVMHITGKITVFDSGDLDNDTDDRSIQLGDHNTVLPSNSIRCLASDKKGVVWVGTPEGIVIFNCSDNVFDGACQGNRPVITLDNFNGYLLEGEDILDIEVDGANRKWVGTTNGLFLLSADGYEQLAYYTAENSPLFDNEVSKLAFDGKTGWLYISTTRGMQSFRTESTTGLRRMAKCCDEEGIHIFPHPVEPDYTGPIAISNLADEANVKITDISGRLVYETTALGGQAIWNGTDYNGRRAQSGVYLVFIVNEGGSQKAVCKILMTN